MKILTTCPRCHESKILEVGYFSYYDWQNGSLKIQEAFPTMHADDRERLISGTCPKCWDMMFEEDDS